MKLIPRIVFWIGTIAFVEGAVIKLFSLEAAGYRWMFGLAPRNFFQGAMACFMFAIAYCVVFIFSKKTP